MKKILAVAAFAFAFSINGYAQEAAPADSSAPAAQKSCGKDKKCTKDATCDKDGKCGQKCDKPCSKGEKPCDCSKKEEAPKA